MAPKEHWKGEPEAHDYPAAADYLSLVLDPRTCKAVVKALRNAPLEHRKAKDLLRASGLRLLPKNNPHVALDLAKVSRGELLSPVLLVRGRLEAAMPLTVADGFHRMCASYHLDEDADIPCRVAELEA